MPRTEALGSWYGRSPNRAGRPTRSRGTSRSPSSSAIRPTRRRPRAAAAGSNREARTREDRRSYRLDAAARLGRRRARQASAQPLRLFLALGHLEGLRPRPGTTRASSASSPSPGFLNGPGFQRMRDYLRRNGRRHLGDRLLARRPPTRRHHPHLPGVQQPVCIVLARAAEASTSKAQPATGYFGAHCRRSSRGKVQRTRMDSTRPIPGWLSCASGRRAPFLPEAGASWPNYPALADLLSVTARASCRDAPGSSRRISDPFNSDGTCSLLPRQATSQY